MRGKALFNIWTHIVTFEAIDRFTKFNFLNTVSPLIMFAPQKCVIPKEKVMLCLFSFGITHFRGADIIRGDTVG